MEPRRKPDIQIPDYRASPLSTLDGMPATNRLVWAPTGERYSPWEDLDQLGLLHLINAHALNARGYHMRMAYTDETWTRTIGFSLVGDGTRPWQMPTDLPAIRQAFDRAQHLLRRGGG